MPLLHIYVATFVLGGILLGASLFLGHHDADADADADLDAGVDAGVDADADAAVHADLDGADLAGTTGIDLSDLWLPFISLRFWVFFLCFFGLIGLLFTVFSLAQPSTTLASALGVGVVSGFSAAFTIQWLKHNVVGLAAGAEDFCGKEARVLLPIDTESPGKIRLEVKGTTVDLIARTVEPGLLERGRTVLVIEVTGSHAIVVPAPGSEPV